MMATSLILVPPGDWRRWRSPCPRIAGGRGFCRLVPWGICSWSLPPCRSPAASPAVDGWLVLDPLGKVVLGFLSVLFFLCCDLYCPGYLALRTCKVQSDLLCLFPALVLAMMTLVVLSHHLGLMWVAMEATTLAMRPTSISTTTPRSLEATWKYLLIGSVGIGLALLGSFFLAYASLDAGLESTLLFDDLVREAPNLSRPWLHAAFVLLLVGYGTKMGLAPMHTWKPDAYGEAPGTVGRIACRRRHQLCLPRDPADLSRSASAAGRRPVQPRDHDLRGPVLDGGCRSLHGPASATSNECWPTPAWSTWASWSSASASAGWRPCMGPCLHLINNGLTKGVLFLSAGNIHRRLRQQVHRRRTRGDPSRCRCRVLCSWPVSWPSPVLPRSGRS